MTRRTIFNSLGQNFILKDGELALELHPWIESLEKMSQNLVREYRRIETDKKSTTVSDNNAFNHVFLKWQDKKVSNEELLELFGGGRKIRDLNLIYFYNGFKLKN